MAKEFRRAAEARALEIGATPGNAVYMLVQARMVAGRNPEWHC